MQQATVALPGFWPADSLVLARRQLSDLPELSAAISASIDDLSAFLRWAANGVPSPADLARAVTERDADFLAGIGFEYVLRERTTGAVVGEAGGELAQDGAGVTIGYWVRSDKTGIGYATAAARALTSLAFDAFHDIRRVEIRMDSGNAASKAIAVRLGFTHIGDERFTDEPLRGQTGIGHIYAMSREDWTASSTR